MTKKRQRRVHAKSYWGEDSARPLIHWLNAALRPGRDPVEQLVRLEQERRVRDSRPQICQLVKRTVRTWNFHLMPIPSMTDTGWNVAWRHSAAASPSQALAFTQALHLASQNLLDRVRKCPRKACSKYFFSRFAHQMFCCAKCRREQLRSTEEWKSARREYMRRLRRDNKERERRQALSGKKRKGGAR